MIQIITYINVLNVKNTITKHKNAETIKDTFIARKIIARSTAATNRLTI